VKTALASHRDERELTARRRNARHCCLAQSREARNIRHYRDEVRRVRADGTIIACASMAVSLQLLNPHLAAMLHADLVIDLAQVNDG
jgi:hypothetical protein